MISDRPAEIEDRTLPGHREGDLIISGDQQSAIGTLVERATRYVLVVHLGRARAAEHVRDALTATTGSQLDHLKHSLTRDQGSGLGRHHEFTLATDMPTSPSTPPRTRPPSPLNSTEAHATLRWDTQAERLAKLLAKAS
ncbi:IS30 family transposase [Saccharothrix ecbatanensis]|uniref:IS30 family transposase n=1 Tax=Saccharothrix ecbatanensis TaxID=1105145 RepID=A0A7W9HUP9_9PSEU|nr:IS30 family transposase [Saccharothrix ecbatanensis]MBB5808803.1 IS30 family transposase [Saccharothrix ecbatanensis]